MENSELRTALEIASYFLQKTIDLERLIDQLTTSINNKEFLISNNEETIKKQQEKINELTKELGRIQAQERSD